MVFHILSYLFSSKIICELNFWVFKTYFFQLILLDKRYDSNDKVYEWKSILYVIFIKKVGHLIEVKPYQPLSKFFVTFRTTFPFLHNWKWIMSCLCKFIITNTTRNFYVVHLNDLIRSSITLLLQSSQHLPLFLIGYGLCP